MSHRFLTVLALILSASLCRAQSSSATVPLKDPVAVVNGEKISKDDLKKNFSDALAASGANPATLTADQ